MSPKRKALDDSRLSKKSKVAKSSSSLLENTSILNEDSSPPPTYSAQEYQTPREAGFEYRTRLTAFSGAKTKYPERKLDLLMNIITRAGPFESNVDIFMVDTFCKKYTSLVQVVENKQYFASKILGIMISSAITTSMTPSLIEISKIFENTLLSNTESPLVMLPIVTARVLLSMSGQYIVNQSINRFMRRTETITLPEIEQSRAVHCNSLYYLLLSQEGTVATEGTGSLKKQYVDQISKKYGIDLSIILETSLLTKDTKKQLELAFRKIPFTSSSFGLVYDRYYFAADGSEQQEEVSLFFGGLLSKVKEYNQAVISLMLGLTSDPGEEIQSSVAKLLKVHKPLTDLTIIWNAVEILNKDLILSFCQKYPYACTSKGKITI